MFSCASSPLNLRWAENKVTRELEVSAVTPLLAQRITLPGNSYFWRTAPWRNESPPLSKQVSQPPMKSFRFILLCLCLCLAPIHAQVAPKPVNGELYPPGWAAKAPRAA